MLGKYVFFDLGSHHLPLLKTVAEDHPGLLLLSHCPRVRLDKSVSLVSFKSIHLYPSLPSWPSFILTWLVAVGS